MKRETTTISFVKVVMHRHGNIFCSGTNISNSEISKHSFKCVILYYAITSIFTTFKRNIGFTNQIYIFVMLIVIS